MSRSKYNVIQDDFLHNYADFTEEGCEDEHKECKRCGTEVHDDIAILYEPKNFSTWILCRPCAAKLADIYDIPYNKEV